MTLSIEKLAEEFKKIGLNVDDDALEICSEICLRQKLTERMLVDTWVAYSLTEFGENVIPTAEKLFQFENKEFSDSLFTPNKKQRFGTSIAKKDPYSVSPVSQKTPKRSIHQVHYSEDKENTETTPVHSPSVTNGTNNMPSGSGIITVRSDSSPTPRASCVTPRAVCVTPNISRGVQIQTGANVAQNQIERLEEHGITSHQESVLKGEVICQYGESMYKWSPSDTVDIELEVDLFHGYIERWRTMMELLRDTHHYCADNCEDVANSIIEKYNLPTPDSYLTSSSEPSFFWGQIVSEEGRCDPSDFKIEGIGVLTNESIHVDITHIGEYSIFPGQIIVIKGTKLNNRKIIATELYTTAPGLVNHLPLLRERLQIMVAAGPFLTTRQLDYTILHNLLDHVKRNQPDMLFLVGPFIDIEFTPGSTPPISEAFKDTHERLLSEVIAIFSKTRTKVHYISSSRDMCSVPVFPTPVTGGLKGNDHSLLPDPVILSVRSFLIGFTSIDVLLHLSQFETSNCRGNRLARLCGHILNQQSFYPVKPAPLDTPVDYAKLYTYSKLKYIPHVIVLPSELRFFIKEVEGCLFINTQRCLRGQNNFAQIEVRPQDGEKSWSVSTHVSAKICKI